MLSPIQHEMQQIRHQDLLREASELQFARKLQSANAASDRGALPTLKGWLANLNARFRVTKSPAQPACVECATSY